MIFIKAWDCLWISILIKTDYSRIFENTNYMSAIYLAYIENVNYTNISI